VHNLFPEGPLSQIPLDFFSALISSEEGVDF
jgi:hypothetical protein